MAVTETITRNSVALRLHFGTSDTGATIMRNLSIGTLKSGVVLDLAKAYAIAEALAPCITYNMLAIQKTTVGTVEESE